MTHDPGPAPDHLDLDTLAELDEGLLSADEAAAAEHHLGECRRCREHQARLRSTRALLSAMPAEAMPPEVSDRIHDTLSRTAASTTILPLAEPLAGKGRWRWRSRPTLAGLGAAAAVVALVAAVLVGSFRDSSPKPQPSTEAGAAAPSQTEDSVGSGFAITASGTRYTASNAQRLVTQLAGGGGATGAGGASSGSSQAQAAPSLDPQLQTLYGSQDALLSCVAALTAGGDPVLPLSVDFGTFTDKAQKLHRAPAAVVVLPGPAGRADGWIVGPDCATAPDNDIYLFERVPLG